MSTSPPTALRTLLDEECWHDALMFSERVALGHPSPLAACDQDLARFRLAAWRSQSPFEDPRVLRLRLATDGLDETRFAMLLGEPAASLRARHRHPLEWVERISRAFTTLDATISPSTVTAGSERAASFLHLVAPLAEVARADLRQALTGLARGGGPAFDPEQVESWFYEDLASRLLAMVSRTAVLELNVARLRGELAGETGTERFASFVAHVRRPEVVLALLAEYPVLARVAQESIDRWQRASFELMQRLCADWSALGPLLGEQSTLGPLAGLRNGMGDTHRGGRSVAVLVFASGRRVVYKPHGLALDVHFAELLDWVRVRGGPDLTSPRVVDRSSHGWVEFVAAAPCSERAELETFYGRLGASLALLYALEATDFHSENLIAAGARPVLVDLESLLQPRFLRPDTAHADSIAAHEMLDSVLRVGILPQRSWAGVEVPGLELSGLGGQSGQLSPDGVPYWTASDTDQMSLARGRVLTAAAQNRPSLRGSEIDVLQFSEQLVNGFREAYRFIARHKRELLARGGPIERFARDEVRVILRHTAFYMLILRESFHPDALRSALDRERLFDRLWYGAQSPEALDLMARVVPSERHDLWQGDVPIFTAIADSRALRDSAGHDFEGFFELSGYEGARARIERFCDDDLRRQEWFLRSSLTVLAADAEPSWASFPVPEPRMQADTTRLIASACAVGRRLASLALRNETEAAWVGVSLVQGRHWTLQPLSFDLYSGLAGVSLFLAQLGAVTGDDQYRRLSQASWSSAWRQLGGLRARLKSIGAFEGWGGAIYVLSHLAQLLDRPELLTQAETLVADIVAPLVDQDTSVDILGGAAGCIGALLTLNQVRPSALALGTAVRCGDRLLAAAVAQPGGLGWCVPISPAQPLTGFAHGAAGVAWALAELHANTGESRFLDAARQAIAFERSVFDPTEGNWPDLREDPDARGPAGARRFMTAWCHGSAGIALSRVRLVGHLRDDTALKEEIAAGLAATLRRGFGNNDCLCHGSLGNVEPFIEAWRILGDRDAGVEMRRAAAVVLERIERHGWQCGVPQGVETPGLLPGLAGIGYGLLRLALPERVPCVLVLDPPIGAMAIART